MLGAIQDITERKRNELELMEAIETVMQDTSWFSRTVIEKLAQIRAPGAPQSQGELADLTRREREILGLICDGHTDAEIAATLHLSRNTVRNHVAALYGKLDVHRRSAAIICASAASWATRNRRASAKGVARAGCSGAIHQTSRKVPVDLVRAFYARAPPFLYWVRPRPRPASRPARDFPQLEPKEQPHGQRPHQRRRQSEGRDQETAGKLTGNRQTEIEGKAEKAVGKVQRNVGEARTRSATRWTSEGAPARSRSSH